MRSRSIAAVLVLSFVARAMSILPRWANRCHNATALWRSLRDDRGFRGGASTVRDCIRAHLRSRGPRLPENEQVQAIRPTARRARWLLTAPSQRAPVNASMPASRRPRMHDSGSLAHQSSNKLGHAADCRDVASESWSGEPRRTSRKLHDSSTQPRRPVTPVSAPRRDPRVPLGSPARRSPPARPQPGCRAPARS